MQYATKVATWSVYSLFALAPFFFIPVPWVGIAEAKLLLLAIATVVGLVAWFISSLYGSFRIPRSFLLGAAALVPIAYLASALVTGASWNSLIGDGTTSDTVVNVALWYSAFFLAAVVLPEGQSKIIAALRFLVIGGIIVLFIQAVRILFPDFTFGGVLTFAGASVVENWHDLGIFLGLMTFLALSRLSSPSVGKMWHVLYLLAAVVSGFFLVVINYSDVWLGLSLLSLMFAFFYYRISVLAHVSRLRTISLWFFVALVSLGMYFGGGAFQRVLPPPLQISQLEVRPSWIGTLEVGRNVFTRPSQIVFGSGPSRFVEAWSLYKPLSVNTTQFWNIDFYYGVGFIPTSFVTTGLFGLLAWSAIGASLLFIFARFIRNAEIGTLFGAALLSGALYLTIFHILFVPGPAISLLLFLMYGLLIAHEVQGGRVREWAFAFAGPLFAQRVLVVCIFIVVLAVTYGGIQSVRAITSDVLVNRAIDTYNSTQDLAATSRFVAEAIYILPNNDRAQRAAVEVGILELTKLVNTTSPDDATRQKLQETLRNSIQHGLSAVSIEKGNYLNWLTLARLYSSLASVGIEGAEEKARTAYADAKKNNPTSPLPYLGEAELDIAKGDDASARVNLELALRVKPDMAVAYFLLSQIEARAGNLDKAQQYAEIVTQLASADPFGWYNLGTIMYVRQNYAGAASSLERAVALRNDYANALLLLGLSYYRLDRKGDALRVLQALSRFSSNSDLETIIARIEAGQDPFAVPKNK